MAAMKNLHLQLTELGIEPTDFEESHDAKRDFYSWLCAQGVAKHLGIDPMGEWEPDDVAEAVVSAQKEWPLRAVEPAFA